MKDYYSVDFLTVLSQNTIGFALSEGRLEASLGFNLICLGKKKLFI